MLKLQFIVVCSLAAVLSAAVVPDACSSAVKIGNKFFAKEVLSSEFTGEPNDVSIQDSTGDIFFTRIDSNADENERLKIFVLKSGSKTPQEVHGIKGLGQSTTVDNDHDIVYFSADSGIYKYDSSENKANVVAEEGTDVIHITYANGVLYAAQWPDYDVFKFPSKDVSVSKPLAVDTDNVYGNYLVVDSKENYYFVSKTNYIYYFPKGYSEKIRILGIAKEPSTIFAVDRKDNVYVTGDKEIYRVNIDNNIPQHIGNVDFDITAFAFDLHNNIILGKTGELLRYNRIDC